MSGVRKEKSHKRILNRLQSAVWKFALATALGSYPIVISAMTRAVRAVGIAASVFAALS